MSTLTLWNTEAIANIKNPKRGTRALVISDGLPAAHLADIYMVHRAGGWRLAHDYRPGSPTVLLEGKDFRGETRHLPIEVRHVRLETAS